MSVAMKIVGLITLSAFCSFTNAASHKEVEIAVPVARIEQTPIQNGPAVMRNAQPVRAQNLLTSSVRQGDLQGSQVMRIVLALTSIALVPSLLACATAFLRIIIVLSMLRHAVGLPETPPNIVVIGLALFLTAFTMAPTFDAIHQSAIEPYLRGSMSTETAYHSGVAPLREFMLRQTRPQDVQLVVELAHGRSAEAIEIPTAQLVPAFMLSELRTAFQIGVLIFVPFLLIDLVVASVLTSLGMMMVPPATIALPIKLLMFILVDGWALVLKALVSSFR